MADKKDDKDEKKADSAGKKAAVSEMEDMDLRVSHLEASVGTSYHPTDEEAAEAAEEAEKAREEAAKEAEEAAAKAAEEESAPA